MQETVREIQRLQKTTREELRNLDRQVVQFAVEARLRELASKARAFAKGSVELT